MTPLRTALTVAIVFSVLSACAQTPVGQASAGPDANATVSDKRMAMMGGMGPDAMSGMKGTHGMGAMPDAASTSGDMASCQDMMGKHMAMMQSMMDQMPSSVVKP